MLDNFIVNIRTVLPKAKANEIQNDKISDYANESAMAFLEQSSDRNTAIYNQTTTSRTMLNVVRSYFSQLSGKKPASNVDNDMMLPRVYDYSDWEPIELKVKEKFIEDIDNVIDKFARVISVNDTNSPRRNELFYVYIHILLFFFFRGKLFVLLSFSIDLHFYYFSNRIYFHLESIFVLQLFSFSNHFQFNFIFYPLSFSNRNEMIARRFVADWHWELKMITWPKFQQLNQDASLAYSHDCKKVFEIFLLLNDFILQLLKCLIGKNLQICYVNDSAAADGDSLSSDSESCPKLSKPITHTNQSTNSLSRHSSTIAQPNPYNSRPLSMKKTSHEKGKLMKCTMGGDAFINHMIIEPITHYFLLQQCEHQL